jgi:DnaK suppressor protein
MNKNFLHKMKETLLAQKKLLVEKAVRHVDIDVDGDEIDEIQANQILEVVNQLTSRDTEKLAKIDNALQRIEDRTYGVCQDCGDKIPEKRLLANPHFLICISCSEERELESKQGKRY